MELRFKTKHYTLTQEGEDSTPDGVETIRQQSFPIDKQYSDIGAGIPGTPDDTDTVAYGIKPKPTEETATIDPGLGAGTDPIDQTYPYPPTPYEPMSPVISPKLQATGDPASIYGIQQLNEVRNTLSGGPYGVVADDQLRDVVQRVEAAVLEEVVMPKDPMKMEDNERLNPDGTLTQLPAGDGIYKPAAPNAYSKEIETLRNWVAQKHSTSIPQTTRTAVGDKWDGDYRDYTEGGQPMISIGQKDMVTQLLGFYEFVTNDIAEGLPTTRFEQKLGQSLATVTPRGQNLEVSITDKIGSPELITSNWAELTAYLASKYPREE